MKKSGHEVKNHLCPHFSMSRAELFSVIKIKKLKTFTDVMKDSGTNLDALGCEICKPAIGSILSSLWNEHVMHPVHHQNQDTNDRFMANIQRNGTFLRFVRILLLRGVLGTFSVIPRIAAGEVSTYEGLTIMC
jgi:nitrite reductase (NAD(P)H)